MNAIPGARPATPQEAAQIADLVYVSKDQLDQIAAANAAESGRIARRDFLRTTGLAGTVVALLGICALQSFFIVVRPPQDRIHTQTQYARDDGTVVGYADWSELPSKVKEDTTVNALWNYVQQRESWYGESAGRWAWRVVSAMSNDKTREAFQGWYDAANKDSPAQQYKDGTTVEARYVHWDYACQECAQEDRNAYRFWFDRYEWEPGAAAGRLKGRYAVTVTIRRNVALPPDRIWQRWTFNAPQVQVIGYTTPQREGITR